jgi:hypothetical protein
MWRVNASVLAFLLVGPLSLRADYIPPSFDETANWCTAIVDATVEELVTREIPLDTGSYKRQEARLRIHRQLYGKQTPTTLTGIVLTCEGELHRIVSPKKRYILCLQGSRLLEEATLYEVREVDGKVECLFRDARSRKEVAWISVAELEEKLRAAREPISAIIGKVTGLKDDGISVELRSWIAQEIVLTPHVGGGNRGALVRQAYEKLAPSRGKEEREVGFEELLKLESWGCLLSCTCHEDEAVRLRAVSLFEGRGEKGTRVRIVRALLPSLEASLAVPAGGTEQQMLQWSRQAGMARVVSAQAGIKVPDPKGDLSKAMTEAVKLWGKWLKEEEADERF